MTLLALDLGTRTGFAMLKGGIVTAGTWKLATAAEVKKMNLENKDRCCDPRFARLAKHIQDCGPVDAIYFEDVQFSSSTQQTQLWASFRAMVVILGPGVEIVAVPVGTLKKFATGKGNADKDMMRTAMVRYAPASEFDDWDDNAIDAYHLLHYARRDKGV